MVVGAAAPRRLLHHHHGAMVRGRHRQEGLWGRWLWRRRRLLLGHRRPSGCWGSGPLLQGCRAGRLWTSVGTVCDQPMVCCTDEGKEARNARRIPCVALLGGSSGDPASVCNSGQYGCVCMWGCGCARVECVVPAPTMPARSSFASSWGNCGGEGYMYMCGAYTWLILYMYICICTLAISWVGTLCLPHAGVPSPPPSPPPSPLSVQ